MNSVAGSVAGTAVDGRPLIAHVIHRFDVGGLENGVVNLVNGLPAERYRHAVVALSGIGAIRARVRRQDVEVVSMDKREGKDLRAYARLWRWFRVHRPAIVHTRNLGTIDCQWVAAAAGVPGRVHGEHGWEANDPQGLSPRALRLRRACRPVIQCFVPMSRDLARWLERSVGVEPARIRQLYSGVDTARFHPASSQESSGAAGDAQVVTIGSVGRLDPVKRQADLIEAVAGILERHPDWRSRLRLIIAGGGALAGALQQSVDRHRLGDTVRLVGACEDVPALLRGMDVFALPSQNEGISNTILEAMASALPVVAARVGGNPELVLDGSTGTLIAPGDTVALGAALERYVADVALRRSHGAAGASRARGEFSLEGMMRRYCELYDDVLRQRARYAVH